ncbi:thiamine diphosphokinase [Paenibacillus senegalensis]|uniref:thiamine diphosphokinase n=1 Tax=Paenibacillus senegalensis TaxID=1465766 RepID=UPI0016524301|nr:thiamine diphosphokinase [Paenibacillus senegalensis]
MQSEHTAKHIIIVSGGNLGEWALNEIRQAEVTIAADSGALFLLRHGITPDYAVGDFDSVSPEDKQWIAKNSRSYQAYDPIDKDYTDTELAFQLALKLQPSRLVLIGVTGTRFDHTLANVHLLARVLPLQIPCCIVNSCNRIYATDQELVIHKQPEYDYCSLLPLSEKVEGITLQGFQYPLSNAQLTIGQSLGISNVLLDDEGVIMIKSGMLLVVMSKA